MIPFAFNQPTSGGELTWFCVLQKKSSVFRHAAVDLSVRKQNQYSDKVGFSGKRSKRYVSRFLVVYAPLSRMVVVPKLTFQVYP